MSNVHYLKGGPPEPPKVRRPKRTPAQQLAKYMNDKLIQLEGFSEYGAPSVLANSAAASHPDRAAWAKRLRKVRTGISRIIREIEED